ncbi:uncharacterized protein LOC105433382 [Pogonomyrmex barbatus]|uniref:Uncharacterized protein LOC105433382 n=1 Tax=Pogonomyrmex barbatus TaxID=144034 RepID=A0A6I9WUK3_9HYME|nr:uncharacterized protein LOC105433382 [Pogonomyrmex barbatus]XP_011646985.1 uncharacterized protein LOC105433382 [Pogonomyrmex barbatus]
MKAWFNRDDDGKVIIDSNGFVTITCEEENIAFQLHISEIDDKQEQMCFNVNGKDIFIDVIPWEFAENDSESDKKVDKLNENKLNEEKFNTPTTSKGGNSVFPWCDASTKIFLKEYKAKKELVKNRQLKNMKKAYQEIANKLIDNGFHVSPLQVENRYKTLKRAYKNMMIYNRRNGRGKYICTYEQDLDEIFSNDLFETETNGEGETKAAMEAAQNCKTTQQNARLEAQNVKIIENLQSCQRLLRNLINKMESSSKNSSCVQNEVLQVCIEMRDIQKEALARAEEQRETKNHLLEEMMTILKSRNT